MKWEQLLTAIARNINEIENQVKKNYKDLICLSARLYCRRFDNLLVEFYEVSRS